MKILLTDIKTSDHIFNLEESIRFPDDGGELKADIRAKFFISQQKEDVYNLQGDLIAQGINSCNRCGIPVQFDIEQDFHYQILLKEEPEVGSEYECTDEDSESLYLTEPIIDSRDILSEQLLLALPAHMVCGDDCKGLCDQCGIDLNKEECNCKEISSDSPFAILKDLQKN
jgi:uncharacterized protein